MPSLTSAPVSSDPAIAQSSRPESCPGCQKTGVPLLTCDDPPPPDASGNVSTTKQRFCADCMIGKQIKVFWPVDNSWYTGVVQKYNSETGEHLLRYDDDDEEWVKIGESASNNPSTGRPNSPSRTSSGERISPIPAGTALAPGEYDPGAVQLDARAWQQGGASRPAYPPYSAAQGQMPPLGYGTPGLAGGYGFPPGGAFPPGAFPGSVPFSAYPPPLLSMPPGPVPSVTSSAALSNTTAQKEKKKEREDGVASPTPSDLSARKKNGPRVWTKDEDAMLLSLVRGMRMPMKWSVVAQSMPDRTGKQCRERYVNHLNPRLKTSDWSPVEDATVFHLYSTGGSHWAKMAKMIPGRTDNGIKNRFHNLRRQLEREDEHRLRLSNVKDFPDEVRLDRVRPFPQHLKGKADELWDMNRGLPILAAQSVLGGGITRNAGRYGPFRTPKEDELCGRCAMLVPSVQTGKEICTKTGWCVGCTKIPPHISGNLLRECLNLRRCPDENQRKIVESWDDPFVATRVGRSEIAHVAV